ncbi:hypothetical protein DFJ74DRAFT_445896 [Hyaloraphidium curvatum]|nr:hypothetical protein DFJ74DRAFT_445896 [Hyaloraphidium curvatum]
MTSSRARRKAQKLGVHKPDAVFVSRAGSLSSCLDRRHTEARPRALRVLDETLSQAPLVPRAHLGSELFEMATPRDIDVSSVLPERTIYERLDAVVRRQPDAIAYVDAEDNRVLSFAELGTLSRRAANFLHGLGVRRGDNVVLWLPNCAEFVALHVGLTRIGANTIALNTRFRTEEMRHFFRTALPVVVVTQGGFIDTDYVGMAEESRAEPRMKIVNLKGRPSTISGVIEVASLDAFPEADAPATGRPEDLAISYTTSGTTGWGLLSDYGSWQKLTISFAHLVPRFPKLATHDQLGLVVHLVLIAAVIEMKAPSRPSTVSADPASRRMRVLEQDTMLCTIPCCGTFGYNIILGPILGPGCTAVVQRFYTPESTNAFAEGWGVTHIAAPDIIIDGLIEAVGTTANVRGADGVERPVKFSFPRWRHALYPNFAALAETVTRKLDSKFGGRVVGMNCYGSSEVMGGIGAWTPRHPQDVRMKNGGTLISPDPRIMEVRVADIDTNEEVKDGEPGELQFHYVGIIQCYLNNEAATNKAFATDKTGKSWYKTGDLGQAFHPPGTTDNRSFVFLGRLGDTLRVRGYLTNPEDIEKELLLHPRVHIAQVVGVQVEGLGDVPIGFVSLKDTDGDKLPEAEREALENDLLKRCRDNLASYKVPAKIHFVSDWPMTVGTNGQKVQKTKLRDIAKERGFVAPKKLGTSAATANSRL